MLSGPPTRQQRSNSRSNSGGSPGGSWNVIVPMKTTRDRMAAVIDRRCRAAERATRDRPHYSIPFIAGGEGIGSGGRKNDDPRRPRGVGTIAQFDRATMLMPRRSARATVSALVEEDGLVGLEGQHPAAGLGHRLDRRLADGRHVEAHVVALLGHLDEREAAAGVLAGAEDGPVGALDGLDGQDVLVLDGDALADVELADLLGEIPAEGDVGVLRRRGLPARQHSRFHEQLRAEVEGRGERQAVLGELVDDREQERVVAVVAAPAEEPGAEAAPVGREGEHLPGAVHQVGLVDLARHDEPARAVAREEADHLAELGRPAPVEAPGEPRERRVGQAAQPDDDQGQARRVGLLRRSRAGTARRRRSGRSARRRGMPGVVAGAALMRRPSTRRRRRAVSSRPSLLLDRADVLAQAGQRGQAQQDPLALALGQRGDAEDALARGDVAVDAPSGHRR